MNNKLVMLFLTWILVLYGFGAVVLATMSLALMVVMLLLVVGFYVALGLVLNAKTESGGD